MSNDKITIVDYGMGNIGSIQNMLKYLNHRSFTTNKIEEIENATKIILPGVGSFDNAIKNIKELGLYELLRKKGLESKTPMLGICLGMQIMCNSSEEGKSKGLSIVDADVIRFNQGNNITLRIPHMGWNKIKIVKNNSALFNGLENNAKFYFVHSYYVRCNNKNDVVSETTYGAPFVSSFEHSNLLGVQFHPEKSHKFGIQLFRNFIYNY